MPRYRAILVEPESQGNIGFIARLIDNFAIDEFFIVNPQCEIGETARSRAVHAQETLESARIVDDLSYAMENIDYLAGTTGIDTSDENLVRTSITPTQLVTDVPEDAALGIMFGREGTGLTNDELTRCDAVVRIPTTDEYPVMNLSHAAAVMFYTCFAHATSIHSESGTSSSRTERTVLENLFKDATGTLNWEQDRQEKVIQAFHNVIGRSYVTGRELSVLLGWFREVRNQMQADKVPAEHSS